MKLHKLYKPLFRLKTRYCIVTGGRGSGKSFGVSARLLVKTFNHNEVILFTRYTMTSAEISIIPEFWEKVESMGLESVFSKTANSIINLQTGSTILFRGLKASSGKQTANLKSITNITTWVLDEAEEMHDEEMFDKIDLSVRKKGVNNEVILVLNPSNTRHMIYRKFFKDRGVYEVCNQVKGDCTYIHTTYLNNLKHLDASFLEIAERAKIDEDRYNNIFLGNWSQGVAGLVFKNWKIGAFPTDVSCWYGTDWGFSNDPTAITRVAFKDRKIYVKEICYQKGMFNNEIARLIKNDFQNKRTQITDDVYIENGKIYTKEGSFALETTFNDVLIDKPVSIIRDVLTEVYCDPSRPEHIAELRKFYGISALGALNADKVGRIEFLKGFEIIVSEDSKNLIEELSTYQWLPSKEDSKELQNKVQDGNDHLIDSLLYSCVSHLRRMGVVNNLGEN